MTDMEELSEVRIFEVCLPYVTLGGVSLVSGGGGHAHDYVGNWLWDDGSCILWDDGAVIAL